MIIFAQKTGPGRGDRGHWRAIAGTCRHSLVGVNQGGLGRDNRSLQIAVCRPIKMRRHQRGKQPTYSTTKRSLWEGENRLKTKRLFPLRVEQKAGHLEPKPFLNHNLRCWRSRWISLASSGGGGAWSSISFSCIGCIKRMQYACKACCEVMGRSSPWPLMLSSEM